MQVIIRLIGLTDGLLAVMPVLLVITLAVAIERFWLLKRSLGTGRFVHNQLRRTGYGDIAALARIAEEKGSTLQGHLVVAALAAQATTADELENLLEEEILDSMPRITRLLWVLDTAVTIAPLLGLFGTIIGMIQAFNVLAVNGGAQKVTGGIADALVSTGAGLLIAIIAVYFVNYFNMLMRQIVQQLDLIKLILINRVFGKGYATRIPEPTLMEA